MDRKPVVSSSIVAIGYDASTAELEVEFKSGVYRYADVGADDHEQLMASASLGRHFASHIKPRFKCRRVVLMPVLVAGEPMQGDAR